MFVLCRYYVGFVYVLCMLVDLIFPLFIESLDDFM